MGRGGDAHPYHARNPDGSQQYVSDYYSLRAVLSLLMIRKQAIVESIAVLRGITPDMVTDESLGRCCRSNMSCKYE